MNMGRKEHTGIVEIAARIELCAIRSEIKRYEMKLEDSIMQTRFRMRCGFYWQLAMQTMCYPHFDPENCERMGGLCGRLIRFSRVLDISDVVCIESANETISEVKSEFQKLSDEVQVVVASLAFGLLDLVQVPEQAKRDLREIWGQELQILGIQLCNNISDTLSVELAQAPQADGIYNKMSESECATAIILSMMDHFKTGTEQVNSDFALRTMALALAGLVSNCRKKRKEFLNFMANAWDKHANARRKIEAAS